MHFQLNKRYTFIPLFIIHGIIYFKKCRRILDLLQTQPAIYFIKEIVKSDRRDKIYFRHHSTLIQSRHGRLLNLEFYDDDDHLNDVPRKRA